MRNQWLLGLAERAAAPLESVGMVRGTRRTEFPPYGKAEGLCR